MKTEKKTRRPRVTIRKHGKLETFEACTPKEWDKCSEFEREIINFGKGYTLARKVTR